MRSFAGPNPSSDELTEENSISSLDAGNGVKYNVSKYIDRMLVMCFLLWALFIWIVDMPYMDEDSHVKEALVVHEWIRSGRENYFTNMYVANPEITTFPGLYFFSFMTGGFFVPYYHMFITTFLGIKSDYSYLALSVFRFSNALLVPAWQMHIVMKLTRHSVTDMLLVVLFPLSFFYNFLFYTDPPATTFVLAALWYMREKRFVSSGIAAAAAVAMRQTNVVWIFGFSLDHMVRVWTSQIRLLQQAKGSSSPSISIYTLMNILKRALMDLWIHSIIGLAFAIFFIHNNFSVVIGHYQHHSMHLHWSQFNYVVLFLILLMDPAVLLKIKGRKTKNETIVFIIVLFFAIMSSEFGYIHHVFLKNDLRHLSSAFLYCLTNFRIIRSCIVPLVVAHGVSKSDIFRGNLIKELRPSLFALCTLIVLIPSPLMEFRYFAVPGVLLLLSVQWTETRKWETIRYFIWINTFSFIVFLFLPFKSSNQVDWEGKPDDRFMY